MEDGRKIGGGGGNWGKKEGGGVKEEWRDIIVFHHPNHKREISRKQNL